MLIIEDAMLATIMTPINRGIENTVIMNRLRSHMACIFVLKYQPNFVHRFT